MDLVKLFTDSDPRGVYIVNLVLCLLGSLWIIGVTKSERSSYPWLGWLGFWVGTAFYYLLMTLASNAPFFLVQIGLYVATAFLLVTYIARIQNRFPMHWVVIAVTAFVMLMACLDMIFWRIDNEGSFHQALTAAAMGLWAWHIRSKDSGKSSTLLTYAVTQLPVQPFLVLLGMGNGDGYRRFEAATYVLYAALKLPLIPVTCFLATRDERASRTNEVKFAEGGSPGTG